MAVVALRQHLVLCGNAYIGAIALPLARRILGVGTLHHCLRADRSQPAARAAAQQRRRRRHQLDPGLFSPFGGRPHIVRAAESAISSVQPPQLAEGMRKRMVRVFPSLADIKVAYAWGGYLDITMSRAPNFGRLTPNVLYLQGFSGHGMTLTVLAGKLVAETVAGNAERFDVFARIPHRDFPGGPLFRRPSLVMAMMYYRLRDLL